MPDPFYVLSVVAVLVTIWFMAGMSFHRGAKPLPVVLLGVSSSLVIIGLFILRWREDVLLYAAASYYEGFEPEFTEIEWYLAMGSPNPVYVLTVVFGLAAVLTCIAMRLFAPSKLVYTTEPAAATGSNPDSALAHEAARQSALNVQPQPDGYPPAQQYVEPDNWPEGTSAWARPPQY